MRPIIEIPGFQGTVVNGAAPDGTLVGVVLTKDDRVRGFTLAAGSRQPKLVDAPGARDTFLQDVASGGIVFGDATDGKTSWCFLLLSSMFQRIQPPRAVESWAGGLVTSGDCCGCFRDASGKRFGFRRLGGRFDEVLPAGAESAVLNGMGEGGDIVGACSLGGQAAGFLLRPDGRTEWLEHPRGEFVPSDCALAGSWMVGSVKQAGGVTVATELRDGTWRTLDIPGGPWVESAAVGVTPGVGIVGWVLGEDGRKRGFLLPDSTA